jgi:hypothetical protein
MYAVNTSVPPDFKHAARAVRRPVSIYRHTRLVLEILFTVVALAVRALLGPEDWRRHFGQVRTGGGQGDAL